MPRKPAVDVDKGCAELPGARVKRLEGMQRARISPAMKAAVELMVYEGVTLEAAAKRVGLRADSARRAFRRPHVRRAFHELISAIRENSAQAALLRLIRLSQSAESETVRMHANMWIAGVDGIAPLRRVDRRVSVFHGFTGFDFEVDDDGEAE